MATKKVSIEETNPVKELIKQRRSQMLIHSCLYYEMNESIVSDNQWQKWADDLVLLQQNFPELCNMDFYDSYFENWDGSTGFDLPLRDPWVYNKALYIKKLEAQNTSV